MSRFVVLDNLYLSICLQESIPCVKNSIKNITLYSISYHQGLATSVHSIYIVLIISITVPRKAKLEYWENLAKRSGIRNSMDKMKPCDGVEQAQTCCYRTLNTNFFAHLTSHTLITLIHVSANVCVCFCAYCYCWLCYYCSTTDFYDILHSCINLCVIVKQHRRSFLSFRNFVKTHIE